MRQTRGSFTTPLALDADVATIDPRQTPAPPFTRRAMKGSVFVVRHAATFVS